MLFTDNFQILSVAKPPNNTDEEPTSTKRLKENKLESKEEPKTKRKRFSIKDWVSIICYTQKFLIQVEIIARLV